MTTLEEMIKHCEAVAKEREITAKYLMEMNKIKVDGMLLYDTDEYESCMKSAKEHRQLAEWLKKLKAYRNAITEMKKWINSNNRGNADYFIVDKIEGIIEEVNANEDSD